jgi:hypothetical protein
MDEKVYKVTLREADKEGVESVLRRSLGKRSHRGGGGGGNICTSSHSGSSYKKGTRDLRYVSGVTKSPVLLLL